MRLKDVTTCPAEASDYASGAMMTCPIENYPEWQRWSGKMFETRKGCEMSCRITGDNRKRFGAMFGKPSFVFRSEFKFDCWLIGLGKRKGSVLVLAARGKGTCYEVVRNAPYVSPKSVIEFMEMAGSAGLDLEKKARE